MTIGLSNSASRSRNYVCIVNSNQGGGDKKAGFPYQIGRGYRTSMAFKSTDPIGGQCCTLKALQKNLVFANISRNLGRNTNASYWRIPGTA